MLLQRFNTAAVTGPRQPDNTCELLLRALDNSGANFTDSKELLKNYLDMTKELKLNTTAEKQPEVIDLSGDEDEDTCIVLDDTLDKSVMFTGVSFEIAKPEALKAGHFDRSVTKETTFPSSSDEIVVLESFNKNTSLSNATFLNKESSVCILKESNQQTANSLKRNKKNTRERKPEVVEILDDDVIVLDDSFTTCNVDNLNKIPTSNSSKSNYINISRLKVTVHGDRRIINQNHHPKFNNISNPQEETKEKEALLPILGYVSCTESQKTHVEFPNTDLITLTNQDNCANNKETNKDNVTSNPKTKTNSKLAYKRPAHLIQPLTQGSQSKVLKTDTGSNIYNPNAGMCDKKTGLRPIVIDGNNVAVSHGKGQFSLKGIRICINYFEKRGHRQIKAFVPQYRKNPETHDDLHKMERQGTVVITPSRKVNGKTVASYDDRYIVQYASEVEGVIVSTDNYRDIQKENPSWKETVEKRLLMFTWVDDLLMFPQDPMGRRGPNLDNFLKFSD